MEENPNLIQQNSIISQSSESALDEMYTHKIISSPDSQYTLEHRRQTPEEKKLIYCVRFDPEDNKYLAIGKYMAIARFL